MPVLFQIKGLVASPSNKGVEEGNGGKKNSDVAYTYKPVGGDTVYVLRPFVDRSVHEPAQAVLGVLQLPPPVHRSPPPTG